MQHPANSRQHRKFWHRLRKIFFFILASVTSFILVLALYLFWPRPLPPYAESFTLIAHRGVSQTFPLGNLENDTCTAKIIYPPTHPYLENTISSIQAAFDYGADMVEIDVHPTTDNQLAVFHDWTIDCRTNGQGITHEQNIATLKQLDIGYGYTADDGQTFPFRGQGIGLMPTFDEVMAAFPNRQFLVDQKDTFEKTVKLLAESLQKYSPQQRRNIHLFSTDARYEIAKATVPELQKLFPTRREAKACAPQYLSMVFSGEISKACRQCALGIPSKVLPYVPGWPGLFLTKAQEANLKVYVIEVDTPEAFAQLKGLPLDGIITNRIEVIGPMLKQ
ncbi:glycerophosphodiester phosphodiesterase family protein [Acaryochloris marina]|uniref:Glycerophosphoryl diester phosphodiesterase n=1 Tax=Acaryochloris marina (strain MBIC 11017) TaxID=329726 RepID=B0CBV8_ACAM1|nr:glycerophosphodiester phosphodiesterase family protein [Acaryochloris marina]ABW30358.1 glycerophosphoryl diester phosphodiesterase [Acaryochloris marina MBIC11017]BDM79179.1 glycerophosphoryl diester phosphodiesterase [Acaryochloris marina MBIC10699]